jgi:16S rRNA (cytidine1402-2'-O)-methyltransferase
LTVPDAKGRVYVVATPIGNLDDLSPRAVRALQEADVLACEDTRRTARICARAGIRTPRISLHAHNEERRLKGLLERLEKGDSVALVSDAGTPLLSDPGGRLVAAAVERGLRVIPIPGPSAVLAALVASGFAAQPFTFVGFAPRRGSARSAWLERLRSLPGTIVLFEAPTRVRRTLTDLHAALGPRRCAVGRELTKRHEEVVHGRLGEIEVREPRGEFTVVIDRDDETAPGVSTDEERVDSFIDRHLERGWGTRDTAREVARTFEMSRGDAYDRVLRRSAPG